ncbi:universal stress protein [Bdellovibrio sp. HCB337]|uniref:universal stress protein n=1 Tax=Bdellovibrio sp. HCB337 TaxID=3394358 RepID=UPI0039A4CE6F
MIPRSILVAEDLENYTEEGRQRGRTVRNVAQDVSKLLQEDLQLFFAEDLKTFPQKKIHNEKDISAWHHDHEVALEELAKELSVKARPVLKYGAPAEEILKAIHSWPRPEMVIMGTQGHRGLERFLEGSVAEEVILKSERPVMVLGPYSQKKFFSFKKHRPRRILVPTDLSRSSRPAEQYGLSLAARLNAELVLFHSVFDYIKKVHDASIISGFASFDMERVFQKMTRDAESLLEKKKRLFRRTLGNCEYVIAQQNKSISEALLEESANNYCMVVMGTHSRRNALTRAFLGSSARETILQAEIPVVVVHSH